MQVLISAVEESLRLRLIPNAIFLAERLVAGWRSDSNMLLLGNALFANHEYKRCMELLRLSSNAELILLAAQCAAQLELWDDAESLLMPTPTSVPPCGATGMCVPPPLRSDALYNCDACAGICGARCSKPPCASTAPLQRFVKCGLPSTSSPPLSSPPACSALPKTRCCGARTSPPLPAQTNT